MTNVLAQPDRASFANDEAYRAAQSLYGLLTGQPDWGAPVSLSSFDDDATYAVTVQNQGTGGHINVPGLFTVTDSGVSIGVLSLTTLTVTGTSTLGVVNASGKMTLSGSGTALEVTNNALVNGVMTAGALAVSTTALVQGNTTLGDANTDAHTVIGVSTFRNAANTATQLYVDAGNNRVIVGSATPLGSDTTPNLQVVGRLYVAPESANDLALQVRRSSAATVGFSLGVTSTNDFVFKDDAGTETFRVGDAASTYQALVTGALGVTNGIILSGPSNIDGNSGTAGQIRIGAGIFGTTNLSSTEKLRVAGTSLLEGTVTLSTGNIDVQSGTGGEIRVGAVIVNAASLSGSEKLRVDGSALISGTLTLNGETSAKAPVVGVCSGALTLTTSFSDISGCSGSLTPGNWLVIGSFDFICSGTDTGNQFFGRCVTSGGTATVTTAGAPRFSPAASGDIVTVTGAWHVSVTATTTAKLQAYKTAGTGSSTAGSQSTLTAVFVGKP